MFVVCRVGERKQKSYLQQGCYTANFFLKVPMLFSLLHIAPCICVCAGALWLTWAYYFFSKLTAVNFNNSLTIFLPLSVFFFPLVYSPLGEMSVRGLH